MGKKRRKESDSSDEEEAEDAKKKKKEVKKKKKKDKKSSKKDKKSKKKEGKKKKQQDSSDSESESSEGSGSEAKEAKRRRKKEDEAALTPAPPAALVELPPPEEGIKRFQFSVEEVGPLGLRFSGGFPPLILAVNPGSFAEKKGVPANFEVHAINGLALVPQNQEMVMSSLKTRPVTLDVRPQGWKPKEKVKELERKRQLEEAERQARIAAEEHRRDQVAREAAEQAEREAVERSERQEQERREVAEMQRKAREAKEKQRAVEEEFERSLAEDPQPLRNAAAQLMEAEYGTNVCLEGTGRQRGLPLRLLTRRKEVAWIWAGETQELIGGGAPDDTWTV